MLKSLMRRFKRFFQSEEQIREELLESVRLNVYLDGVALLSFNLSTAEYLALYHHNCVFEYEVNKVLLTLNFQEN